MIGFGKKEKQKIKGSKTGRSTLWESSGKSTRNACFLLFHDYACKFLSCFLFSICVCEGVHVFFLCCLLPRTIKIVIRIFLFSSPSLFPFTSLSLSFVIFFVRSHFSISSTGQSTIQVVLRSVYNLLSLPATYSKFEFFSNIFPFVCVCALQWMNKCNPTNLNHVAHCNSHTNKFRLSQPSKWRTGKEKLFSVRAFTMKSTGFYLISSTEYIYTPASAVSQWSYSGRIIFEQMSKHEARRHMYILVRREKGERTNSTWSCCDVLIESACARVPTTQIRLERTKTKLWFAPAKLTFTFPFVFAVVFFFYFYSLFQINSHVYNIILKYTYQNNMM